MKRHKWSADNIAFGSGGVLELCSHFANADDFFFLHVKPKFAQFSAAYLRHVPWVPELFFPLVQRDASVSRESAHKKCLARRV